MEKLQAALEKARQKRAGTISAPPSGVSHPGGRGHPRGAEIAGLWAGLPQISVPPAQAHERRLVSLQGGSEAAPYDVLRTKILQLSAAHGWRRVAITSPTAGCGKTTTALNLALSLGRQIDMRTLLIDMDMRRPSLAGFLDQQGTQSVSDMLEGRAEFADIARRLGSNVGLGMNFAPVRDPSDLILRQSTPGIFEAIERSYQPGLMLFDMPPLTAGDDTAAFLRVVDCAMIVAEAETTTIRQIDACEKELAEQTNVLGVVLNKCRIKGDDYAYG